MSEDFGSYLKHERELRGVPLDEIAQSTKISIGFLRALEESRFEDLPGEVFVKGFIRSYGQAIGLNVDELLAAYHASGSKVEDSETTQISASPVKEKPPERQPGPMKAIAGFGIALLVIAGGVYWFTSQKDEKAEQPQPPELATPLTVDNTLPEMEVVEEPESTAIEEQASAPVLEEKIPKSETKPEDTGKSTETAAKVEPDKPSKVAPKGQSSIKNTVTVSENDVIIENNQEQVSVPPQPVEASTETDMGDASLQLVIRVTENSWFNLRVDDQRDQDFILPPGGSKTVQAKFAVVMTIGNRRATELTLNGQTLDLPESPDNVIRNLTVNAEQLN